MAIGYLWSALCRPLSKLISNSKTGYSVVESHTRQAPVVYLGKKLNSYCLVLVGSRNGFERDFTIELK